MSSDPQVPANPSSPVTGNCVSSDDNASRVTKPIRTTPTSETLQETIDPNHDTEKCAQIHDHDLQYKYLVKRFNFKVVLSTFACALVVAYLTLINNIARAIGSIDHAHGIPFNIFMLLGYLSISLHASSTIVSSRSAVLCSDPEFVEKNKDNVESFKTIFSLCQHLNLYGIILFALAVLGSSFSVFEYYVYPLVFCGCSLVVIILIFAGKYGELSLILWDLKQIWDGITKALRRGGT